MTTKPPSSVREFPADALEKVAYTSVAAILTEELNDRNRLGYHIWRWLKTREGTLDHAVEESGARLQLGIPDAVKTIREELAKQGINV